LPVSYYDDASSKPLLKVASGASTNDYEDVKGGGGEGEKRQRHGLKGLFRQKTFFSTRSQSTFDGNFAHGKPGWWKKQMLVDRSLRSMAVFTALCAVIMLIILISYLPAFAKRINLSSTSVGGKEGETCAKMESRNVVCSIGALGIIFVADVLCRRYTFLSISQRP